MRTANSFTTTFVVSKTLQEVFDAINNPGAWWPGHFTGDIKKQGGIFEYTYVVPGAHWSKQKVTTLTPNKIEWEVLDSKLAYAQPVNEWNGTRITFDIVKKGDKTEVTFAHVGLTPSFTCYADCSYSWGTFVNGNLHEFIEAGQSHFDATELLDS